ncbi:hypothetical protein ACFE33_08145 [Falsihalocynthiibacter sp. SS001]|uniref:hypothetical protein n=1 Tax=Falsihalocynthiibacter sp. SS001 TaxID=3349698 RepID=UPI0036D24256
MNNKFRNDVLGIALFAGVLTAPVAAFSQQKEPEPLSAIDWLSRTFIAPSSPSSGPDSDIAKSASPETIETTSLDQQTADAVGLIPSAVSGFPLNLWGNTSSKELARLFNQVPVITLPALQDLTMSLLLAELDPPKDATANGQLFQARIDKLLDIGALEQASALLDRATVRTPSLFSRSFDIALLTENENAACDTLNQAADLAPTITARVFCLARGGDWNAAALIFETGRALGYVDDIEEAVLARFLDPEYFEDDGPLPLVVRPSPLMFRLYNAVGEPVPTTLLPRAYAHTDLTVNNGWRARIEAAEKLVHSGAVSDNVLLALYTDRPPSASGGVWDRVEAVQRFDKAVKSGDPAQISATLPVAWEALQSVDLEPFLAHHYAEEIAQYPLTGEAKDIALKLAFLSEDYELAAQSAEDKFTTNEAAFLTSLAKGQPELNGWNDERAIAVHDGFSRTEPDPLDANDIENGNYGAAILKAITLFAEGSTGDLHDVTRAIAILRSAGLEDVARRASLELMLLERD